jgi:hypothetical protein
LVVKALFITTHDFYFDAREEATGAFTKAANYQFQILALALWVCC